MTQPDARQPDITQAPADDEGEKLVLASPEEASTRRDYILWAGVILLTALTIYAPALYGKFLWDDDRHVELNRNLRDLPGLGRIWTKFGIRNGGTVQYYPLTHTTFWLEYQLSGAQPGQINPLVFHVTNVVLHAGGAILLWLVLRELKAPGAWVAAAVWALHPIQVESVAWISERKNVLAGVFFFGSILVYLRSSFGARRERPGEFSDRHYWIALGLFACALLSKTIACSMPAVALLLIWWKRGTIRGRDVVALSPFFALGLLMAWLTFSIETADPAAGGVGAVGREWDLSLTQRVRIAGNAIWFYIGKLLWPAKLTFIYPRWNPAALNWIAPLGVLAVAGALFALRSRIGRAPLAAFLIFCGVLVPALGFFDFYPMRYSFVADHFQYLAGPALIALVVGAAARLMRRLNAMASAAPYVIAGLLLVVLCALTLMQSRVYADQISLWGDAVRKNPSSPMLNYNYGLSLLLSSDELPPEDASRAVNDALPHFEQATALDPRHDRAYVGWGSALVLLGRFEDAADRVAHAIDINPKNIEAWINRGRALFELGRLDESQAAYRQALALAEEVRATGAVTRIKAATIHQYLGKISRAKNDLEAATREYGDAVRIAPDSSLIRYEYGQLLTQRARLFASTQPAATRPARAPPAAAAPSAGTQPATTQAVATTQPVATTQAAAQYQRLLTAAAEQYARAIELRPDFLDARIALARLMIGVGNVVGARNQLVAALRIDANYPPLMEAAREFDAKMRELEQATTRPTSRATTGATSAPATGPTAAPTAAPLAQPGDALRPQVTPAPPATAPAAPPVDAR